MYRERDVCCVCQTVRFRVRLLGQGGEEQKKEVTPEVVPFSV